MHTTREGLRCCLTFFIFGLFLAVGGEKAEAQDLCINEIQVANVDQFIDPSYNYGGWVELYNAGEDSIPLKGYAIRHTNEEGKMEKCTLQSAHGTVPPKGFAVVWFDHNSKDGYYGGQSANQIPFKLDADGGVIELLDAEGTLADVVEYPECIARCSWMRLTDGAESFGWTTTPSPNATNDSCSVATERLLAPKVNCSGGTFKEEYSFRVNIPEGCTLHYTTDCSTPEQGTSSVSLTGIFQGTESVIYRFMLSREGCLNSPVATCSLFKDEGTYTLPILSVNTAPKNFFDDTIGLYVTGTNGRRANNSSVKANQNMDWERPVNVEYFVPDSNEEYCVALNQEAGFSIFGGWTRFNVGNKDFQYRSSFKLKSDKVFEGKNTFDYQLFGSKPYVKIKNFLVRNGGQDRVARITDGAMHELLRTSGVYIDCQAWQPAHIYLNGKYLGMMNLREESNKQFAFSNYGIEKDEIDQWEGDTTIKEGDRKALDEWYKLSGKLAASPTDTTLWNSICKLVDIDEYCNYMAAEIYMGNQDWLRGGLKNVKGFRAKDDGGKFHLVLHDVDGCFGDTNMLQQIYSGGAGSLPTRFKNMLMYEPFKKQFIDAYCLMDGSVFEPQRCKELITAMRDKVNPALMLEGLSADERAERLISRIGDETERRPALKQSLKSAFELTEEYTVALRSNTPEARLLLNGQEVPTGKFNGYLFAPVTLISSAPEGFDFKEWVINGETASTEPTLHLSEEYQPGTFDIEAVYLKTKSHTPSIVINEVSSGNDIFINEYGKKADWVELYNNTDNDFDLAGIFLSDDPENVHKFQLPACDSINTVIPPHAHLIIWCDGKDSRSQLHAPFKLKNSDEAFISVTDAKDEWTDSLRYKEQPRWSTFGRFPDGGSNLALLERPTIEAPNRICITTPIDWKDFSPISISIDSQEKEIIAVRYYNLNGQLIENIDGEHVVIQQRIYSDGTMTTRKIVVN